MTKNRDVSLNSGSLEHLSCPLCNDTLRQTVILPGCLHRFCRGCIETHWLSHKAIVGCPECSKHVPGQRECKTHPLQENQTGALTRFDAYFRDEPQSALEVAIRAGGGIEQREEEYVPSLRPPYSILGLRDARSSPCDDVKRVLPFWYIAMPRNKTVLDVKKALLADEPLASASGFSMCLEWADPVDGGAPRQHSIEDESVTIGDLLDSVGLDGTRMTIALMERTDFKP